MIEMQSMKTVRMVPGASIAETVLAYQARESAMLVWEQQLAELQLAAERMESAMAVAADPSAQPSQRLKALGDAERFHEHMQERWSQIEQPSRAKAMDAFLAMGAGVSALQLTASAEGVKQDLQLPVRLRSLLEAFHDLKDDLATVLDSDMELARRQAPDLHQAASMLMAPGMSPG